MYNIAVCCVRTPKNDSKCLVSADKQSVTFQSIISYICHINLPHQFTFISKQHQEHNDEYIYGVSISVLRQNFL